MDPEHTDFAVVLSERIGAFVFISVLAQNGVKAKARGCGSALVRVASGKLRSSSRVLIARVRSDEFGKAKTYARLCSLPLTVLPPGMV
jgi:hypothetical protein